MNAYRQKWLEDIDSHLGVQSSFILAGNVHDKQIASFNDRSVLTSLESQLHRYLSDAGYERIVFYERMRGFFNDEDPTMARSAQKRSEELASTGRSDRAHGDTPPDLRSGALVMAEMMQDEDVSTAVVFGLATSAVANPSLLSAEEQDAFACLLGATKKAALHKGESDRQLVNVLVIAVDKVNDVPSWFFLNNPNVRTIDVPMPDIDLRESFIRTFFAKAPNALKGYAALPPERQGKLTAEIANLTHGFSSTELNGFLRKCEECGVEVDGVRQALSRFKYGRVDNMWERVEAKDIAEAEKIMQRRVKGQGHAIAQAIDIIYRAASGLALTGSASGSARPKGVLFLAGPTGTGKTELAKSITEALFADESRMIRFDMSEFSAEHSDQRLFGAPPGYVGYEAGGELTNAVRNQPFSVLLFDEIEKAHSSIFDKFLQILDDGRLTDSHGETVYFGETLIIFTSNYGMARKDPLTGETTQVVTSSTFGGYEDLKRHVLSNIRSPEKGTIFRPEFINRIGENFVVFDFISEAIAGQIVRAKLSDFAQRVQSECHVELAMTWEVFDGLLASVRSNLDMGGRGVMNVLESEFVNPLAKTLFQDPPSFGSVMTITGRGPIEDTAARADAIHQGALAYSTAAPFPNEGFFLADEGSRRDGRQLHAG